MSHSEKEPIIYEGDLMDEEGVLDFLTSLEAMDLPDRIEEVNAKILSKIIEETDYVAVLFCKCTISSDSKKIQIPPPYFRSVMSFLYRGI